MQKIKNYLEMDFMVLHKWFHEGHKVLKNGKCHYNKISDDDSSHKIILNNNEIGSSNEEQLLGILLDNNITYHITYLCEKEGQKLRGLAKINHYLTPD